MHFRFPSEKNIILMAGMQTKHLEIPYTFYYALPDAGCTLYAKWLEAYTITFNTGDGGPAVEPLPVAKEIGVAKKLPLPRKERL